LALLEVLDVTSNLIQNGAVALKALQGFPSLRVVAARDNLFTDGGDSRLDFSMDTE
jgi:hypothetical protein